MLTRRPLKPRDSSSGKKTQHEINYRSGGPNHRCGMCLNYRVPRTCVRVAGEIAPDAVCDDYNVTPMTIEED